MSGPFHKVRFHIVDKDLAELRSVGARGPALRGVGRPSEADDTSPHFNSDEAAARYYLSQVLAVDERPVVRGLAGTDRTELIPDVRLSGKQEMPLTNTRLVRFGQTQKSVAIFGSRIVVELDQNRELVGVTGGVADVHDISPVPALSPAYALGRIAALAQVPEEALDTVGPPELTFFHDDENETWHLAYLFKKVPAAPPGFLAAASGSESHSHRLRPSPRQLEPELNYLVDAHDGDVLFYYSSAPTVAIPSKCKGVNELNETVEFWGRKVDAGFEMNDPRRFVKTYDHDLRDLHEPVSDIPVRNPANDWAGSHRAAVSAHVNATRVHDFYNSVLMRDSIDDKGMELVSVVNCTYSAQPPPEWHNACWYRNRMWYGQYRDESGSLRSYSRFLDVIAHELTHGVTEHTSGLVYRNQSGALDESFSDIFGIIINNWYNIGAGSDVDLWNWEIGPGLGPNGLPLRDMSDPTRTGDPDHMDDFRQTSKDHGGVHANSNIHNKAAYNLLTARDGNGERVFTPREVAVLYYLCLCKISSLATFSDVLESLVDVAKVYWAGDHIERAEKIAAIRGAYECVGII